ncbi:MAG: PilZ domain-containing protein [Desulfobulbaceae bacterium]|nr:PilZ domain-containing protein [Desulfobulbaceae bacterium]
MTDKYQDGPDRRQSVRVVGRNLFHFQRISPEKFAHIYKDFEAGIPPHSQEGLADIQMFIGAQSALTRIGERDKDLGDFLAHLDTKINLLLKKATEGQTIFDKLKLSDLNLSGKGISFIATEEVKLGDILELHIALLPAYTYVYCFGKVMACKVLASQGDEPRMEVAAEFVLIMEEDQEKLIQHNFKQQSLALRNRRLNKG